MNASFCAGVIVEDKLYYSENNFNSLCCIDLLSGKVKIISDFPEEKSYQDWLHRKALTYKEKIIFLPEKAHYIHVYDLNNHKFEMLPLKRVRDQYSLFCDGFVEDGLLWLFPRILEQPILVIDIEHKQIVDEIFVLQEIKADPQNELFTKLIKIGQYVYLVTLLDNKIVKFDIAQRSMEYFSFEGEKFYSVFSANNDIWIGGCNQQYLYQWESETNILTKHKVDDLNSDIGSFVVAYSKKDGIYLVSTYGRKIYRLGANSHELIMMDDPVLDSYTDHFLNYDIWREQIVLFPQVGASVEVLSGRSSLKLELDFSDCITCVEEKYLESMAHAMKDSIIHETECNNLNLYLKAITLCE